MDEVRLVALEILSSDVASRGCLVALDHMTSTCSVPLSCMACQYHLWVLIRYRLLAIV